MRAFGHGCWLFAMCLCIAAALDNDNECATCNAGKIGDTGKIDDHGKIGNTGKVVGTTVVTVINTNAGSAGSAINTGNVGNTGGSNTGNTGNVGNTAGSNTGDTGNVGNISNISATINTTANSTRTTGRTSTTSSSPTTQRKLSYEIDPEFQNLVASEDGLVPLATFSSEPEYFVYGGIFSLSNQLNGPESSGYQSALAMQCAVRDVNTVAAERGPNTTFFYNIFNDKSSATSAMGAAVQILTAGIPVTIGPTSSDAAITVAALYASFNYTIVSGSATANVLSDQSTYGAFYRTIPSDEQAANVIGNLFLSLNWTLVTPLYTQTAYGLSGQNEFTTVAIEKGILVTCGRVFPPGQLNGISSTVNCLKDSQSSVVLLWMSADDAANVINALYDAGGLDDLTFVATDAWGDIEDLTAFTGGRFPISYLEGSLSVVPKLGDPGPFHNCVQGLKGDSDILPFFTDYWELVLRCTFTDDTGVELCPAAIQDRESFPNNTCRCRDTDNLAMHQVNYIYDAVFAVYNALYEVNADCEGVSERTGQDFCGEEELTSADLQVIIGASSFQGLTGIVAFNGNDPTTIEYEIFQRRDNGVLVQVGFASGTTNMTGQAAQANGSGVALASNQLEWKNGKLPISAIVPSQITFADPIGWVTLIFICIGLLIAFAFSIYFFVNRREKVVKKTSPFFSQLMLLGIILCIMSQIFWDVSQETWTCIVKIWLLAIGFGLIMGNLLAKTYRIFKIFNNARVTSLVIRDTDLLAFTGVVILLEIILLSLYTFTSGLPRPVAIQSTSDSLLKIVKCEVPSGFVQLAGIIVLLGVNFLLVLGAVVIAYLTRNVDSAFNESRYIAYTVYIYLLVTIILLPLYYTAGDSSSSNSRMFIIRSIAILVPMYFTLGALFLPKIYLVNKTKRAERKLAEQEAKKDEGRRIVDFGGTSTQGPQTTAYAEGSTTGGGAYSKALRGVGGTTTTSSDGEGTQTMPGGPKISTGSTPSTATQSQTGGQPGASEYSSLISSLTKRK